MVFPQTSRSLAALALAAGLCLCMVAAARAQDRLTFRDNRVQDGKIVRMDGNAVVINVPSGQLRFDLGLIARVDAAPPPTYKTGMDAYGAGQFDKALADLKPIVDTFRGLPTDWASQVSSALIYIYLGKNDLTQAEAALNDYRRYYAAAAGGANNLQLVLAQARIAFARNDAAKVQGLLAPLTQAALKTPAETTRADGAVYGQAFYLLAKLQERDNKYQEALEGYLRVVTVFYQDAALTKRAQESADALRAAHKDVHVP